MAWVCRGGIILSVIVLSGFSFVSYLILAGGVQKQVALDSLELKHSFVRVLGIKNTELNPTKSMTEAIQPESVQSSSQPSMSFWQTALSQNVQLQDKEDEVRKLVPCGQGAALLCSLLAIEISNPEKLPMMESQKMREMSYLESGENPLAYLAAIDEALRNEKLEDDYLKIKLLRKRVEVLRQMGDQQMSTEEANRLPASETMRDVLTNPDSE